MFLGRRIFGTASISSTRSNIFMPKGGQRSLSKVSTSRATATRPSSERLDPSTALIAAPPRFLPIAPFWFRDSVGPKRI